MVRLLTSFVFQKRFPLLYLIVQLINSEASMKSFSFYTFWAHAYCSWSNSLQDMPAKIKMTSCLKDERAREFPKSSFKADLLITGELFTLKRYNTRLFQHPKQIFDRPLIRYHYHLFTDIHPRLPDVTDLCNIYANKTVYQ